MKSSTNSGFIIGALIAFGILIVIGLITGIIAWSYYWSHNDQSITFTVNSVGIKAHGNSSTYMVYTNKGVFQDSDSLWRGKFDSSDLYNQLSSGKTFTCDTVGYRNQFLSAYKNLLSCAEAKQ